MSVAHQTPPAATQWASAATASAGGDVGFETAGCQDWWLPQRATGVADVAPACVTSSILAWKQSFDHYYVGDQDWLQLSFSTPAYATSIEIFETHDAPFVTSVEIIDPSGNSTVVFSGPDTTTCGSALTLSLSGEIVVAQVKIYVQQPLDSESWPEIDAVRMTGALSTSPPLRLPSSAMCLSYKSSIGCDWTKSWSCPSQPEIGSSGVACSDGSVGFMCCCESDNFPLPSPPPPASPQPPLSPPSPPASPAQPAQWARFATASSEFFGDQEPWRYGKNSSWRFGEIGKNSSALKATGPADVAPACTESYDAWRISYVAWQSSFYGGTENWLQVSFTPAYATSVEIFETHDAPFVTSVELIDPSGNISAVFSGPDTTACGSALTLSLSGEILVAQVKIYVESMLTYPEIDAVRMRGIIPRAPTSPTPPPLLTPAPPPLLVVPLFPQLAIYLPLLGLGLIACVVAVQARRKLPPLSGNRRRRLIDGLDFDVELDLPSETLRAQKTARELFDFDQEVQRKLALLRAQHAASSRTMHMVKGLVSSYLVTRKSSPSSTQTELKEDQDDVRMLDSAVQWCHRQQVFVDLAQEKYHSRKVATDIDVMLRHALGESGSITLIIRQTDEGGSRDEGRVAGGAALEVLSLRCCCDSTLMEIVVEEVLSNARKYGDPSSPIQIRAELCGSRLCTTITNRNKAGVPRLSEEQCARVFEAGFVGPARTQTSSGVGLDTVRVAAEAANGRAWMSTSTESFNGHSSHFTSLHFSQPASLAEECFSPPLRPSASDEASTQSQPCGQPRTAAVEPLKIVCVDDQPLLLRHMRTLCQQVLPVDVATSSWVGANKQELDAFVDLALGRLDKDMNKVVEPRQADIAILDQNLLLAGKGCLLGTDLVMQLRAQGFRGKCLLVTASVGSELVGIRATPGLDAVASKGDPRLTDLLTALAQAQALKGYGADTDSSADNDSTTDATGKRSGGSGLPSSGSAGSSDEAEPQVEPDLNGEASNEAVGDMVLLVQKLEDSFKRQDPTWPISHCLKGVAAMAGAEDVSRCVQEFEENPNAVAISRIQQMLTQAPQPQKDAAETDDSQEQKRPRSSSLADNACAEHSSLPMRTKPDASAAPPLPTEARVLIADDSAVNRKLLELDLRKAASGCKWAVEMATTAEQALELARDQSYDLVFLDEHFGSDQMVGSQAARLIRRDEEMQHPQRRPTVLISFSGDTVEGGARPGIMACGFDSAWPKARATARQLEQLAHLLAEAQAGL